MIRRVAPVVALVLAMTAAPAQAVIAPDTHCRSGKVSITFDDGPHGTNTPKLMKILRKHHAQATFFVQGTNVKRYPAIVKAMIHDGHAVENHSWDHPHLTRLSDTQIANQISRTSSVIKKYTAIAPRYMRPPYGDTNARVRKIIGKKHLVQKPWTIDTGDWRDRSSASIRNAALHGLHKHRSNVILMHDAVTNSPRTLAAVPGIIVGLRKRGYCLVPLQVTAPDSRLRAADRHLAEATTETQAVTVRFTLDAASQRAGSFRIHTVDGTATAPKDYRGVSRRLSFPRGTRSVTTTVTFRPDQGANVDKAFTVKIDTPVHVRLVTRTVRIAVADNGASEPTEELAAPRP